MITLTEKNFAAEVLATKKLVLVDFWAPWCGPCRLMGEILGEMGKMGEVREKIKIGKVNVDENPSVAAKYGIMSIPTLIFFKNGKEIKRMVGVRGKEELVKLVKLV